MQSRAATYRLTPTELFKLGRAQDTVVRVCRGIVWITEQGEWCDHFLSQTQSYRIRGHGLVLIGAASTAVIEFELVPPGIHLQESK